MKKFCKKCSEERDIEDFLWKYKAKGIRQSLCRFCIAKYGREHYRNNKQIYVDRAHTRTDRIIEENQLKLFAYLSDHPCVDCVTTDIRVLEFDHVQGTKKRSIARMVRIGTSWSTIEAEIAKCEVRCANCHRIKTGEKGNSWRHSFDTLADRLRPDPSRTPEAMRKAQTIIKNQQRLYSYLIDHPCVDCGCSDIRVLEFDHVRGTKFDDVARILTSGGSWPRIEAEIEECDVRCVNCHRIKTSERGGWWRHLLDL